MRVAIEAILDYQFAEPTDVLLAVEAAAVPDPKLVSKINSVLRDSRTTTAKSGVVVLPKEATALPSRSTRYL